MENKYCSNCGSGLEKNIRFCPKCGTPVSENVEQQETVEDAPKTNRKSLNALFAVLGAILIIVCGAVYFSDSLERREARLAREKFVKDSLEQVRKDSIKLAKQIEKERQDSIAHYKKVHDPETILARVKEIFGDDDYFSEDYKATYTKLRELGDKYCYPIVGPDYVVWYTSQGGDGDLTTKFGKVLEITEKTAKIPVSNIYEYERYDGYHGTTTKPLTLFLIYENDNWFVDDIADVYSKSLKTDMKKEIKEILNREGL